MSKDKQVINIVGDAFVSLFIYIYLQIVFVIKKKAVQKTITTRFGLDKRNLITQMRWEKKRRIQF